MIGRNGEEFCHPDEIEAVRNAVKQIRHGQQLNNIRARCRHRDGRDRSFLWMGVWSEVDKRLYFVARDMTEIDAIEAKLRQAQKMEAVGRLTGGIAHDFNNVLLVITANIEALAEGEQLPRDLRGRIADIEQATQQAADLTRQLLAFSRRQALRPEQTDINDVVGSTVSLMRRTLGEAVEIETRLHGDLWMTEVDPQVRQSVAGQLRRLGYRVVEAADGAMALATLDSMSSPVDLMLTDAIMPGRVQGRALAEAVRKRWPQVRIVFMSGYAEEVIAHDGRLDDGVLPLNKPSRRRDLAKMLRLALDGP